MRQPAYLDNQATTPLDQRVLEAMMPFLTNQFGNASSAEHRFGWEAEEAVTIARETIADALGVPRVRDVIFTSSATESNNLAILGAARAYRAKGNHMISVVTEHRAILDPLAALRREGGVVTLLPVGSDGLLDLNHLADAIRDDTVLVSVMAVNNEVGVIQDLAAIAECVHARDCLLHTDAVQAVGKIPVSAASWDVDLMSISGHKVYGPKGVGALVVRRDKRRVRLAPLIHGGGHEQGFRSGTFNVPGIVGMAEAVRLAVDEQAADRNRLAALRDTLWHRLKALGGVHLNGHIEQRIAGNLNISIEGVDNGQLLRAVAAEIAISSGSACATANPEPSHVITAMIGAERAKQAIRIGLGRFNSAEDVERAGNALSAAIQNLRQST